MHRFPVKSGGPGRLVSWLLSGTLLLAPLAAGAPTPPNEGAVQALEEGAEGPIVDGLVTDEQWESVEPFTGFIQQEPDNGAPATERTEVRLLLSDQTLYVGVIAFDGDPGGVLVSESRRDGDLNESDSVQILLDTFNDSQNAFLFGTNPEGIEYDGQIAGEGATGGYNPRPGQRGSQRGGVTGFNANWDGDWTVRSQTTERGWETEFAIPLRTLRYQPGSDRTWGLNVMRNIRRKNEQVFLAPIPRGYNIYRVSLAQKISGLDLPGRRDIKVTPFALGEAARNALAVSDDARAREGFDVGLDVKWGVTPNLTVDLTANTDFAQVEADDQQINLTRFPLFFPEKRPFFLENASTFQFGAPQEVDLFFSRRIGLSGGQPVPILAGARLSGKVNSFNVGVMNMQTDAAFDAETGGLRLAANNYTVARVQREFGRSNVGGILVNRQANGEWAAPDDNNRSIGADAAIQVSENLRFFTFLAKTSTPNAPEGGDLAGRAFLNYAGPAPSGARRVHRGRGELQLGGRLRAPPGVPEVPVAVFLRLAAEQSPRALLGAALLTARDLERLLRLRRKDPDGPGPLAPDRIPAERRRAVRVLHRHDERLAAHRFHRLLRRRRPQGDRPARLLQLDHLYGELHRQRQRPPLPDVLLQDRGVLWREHPGLQREHQRADRGPLPGEHRLEPGFGGPPDREVHHQPDADPGELLVLAAPAARGAHPVQQPDGLDLLEHPAGDAEPERDRAVPRLQRPPEHGELRPLRRRDRARIPDGSRALVHRQVHAPLRLLMLTGDARNGRTPDRKPGRPAPAGISRPESARRNLVEDLGVLGEAPRVVLGVHEFAVHLHVEDALAAFDELGLHAAGLPDGRRQTGGVREVVSNDAVLDRNLHESLRELRSGKAPGRGKKERDDGGADGTRTRDLRRDRPAFWTN